MPFHLPVELVEGVLNVWLVTVLLIMRLLDRGIRNGSCPCREKDPPKG